MEEGYISFSDLKVAEWNVITVSACVCVCACACVTERVCDVSVRSCTEWREWERESES